MERKVPRCVSTSRYRWIVEFVTPPQGGRRRHRRKVSQWWNLITLFDVLSQLEIEAIHFPPPQQSSRHAMDKVLGWRWGWRVSERLNWIPNYDYKRICGAHYTLYYITAFPLKPVPDDMRFWWMDSHRVNFCVNHHQLPFTTPAPTTVTAINFLIWS